MAPGMARDAVRDERSAHIFVVTASSLIRIVVGSGPSLQYRPRISQRCGSQTGRHHPRQSHHCGSQIVRRHHRQHPILCHHWGWSTGRNHHHQQPAHPPHGPPPFTIVVLIILACESIIVWALRLSHLHPLLRWLWFTCVIPGQANSSIGSRVYDCRTYSTTK